MVSLPLNCAVTLKSSILEQPEAEMSAIANMLTQRIGSSPVCFDYGVVRRPPVVILFDHYAVGVRNGSKADRHLRVESGRSSETVQRILVR